MAMDAVSAVHRDMEAAIVEHPETQAPRDGQAAEDAAVPRGLDQFGVGVGSRIDTLSNAHESPVVDRLADRLRTHAGSEEF